MFLEANRVAVKEKIKVLGEGSISGVDLNKFKPNLRGRKVERRKHQIPDDATVALFWGALPRIRGYLSY